MLRLLIAFCSFNLTVHAQQVPPTIGGTQIYNFDNIDAGPNATHVVFQTDAGMPGLTFRTGSWYVLRGRICEDSSLGYSFINPPSPPNVLTVGFRTDQPTAKLEYAVPASSVTMRIGHSTEYSNTLQPTSPPPIVKVYGLNGEQLPVAIELSPVSLHACGGDGSYEHGGSVHDYSSLGTVTIGPLPNGQKISKIEFSLATGESVGGVIIDNMIVQYGAQEVLCNVADSGRVVPFQYQTDPRWALDPFGISSLSSNSGTMAKYGCSVTVADMIFESYGIKNTPRGSPTNPVSAIPFIPLPGLDGGPLTPSSLNKAMANYRTAFISPVGATNAFSIANDPYWPGVVEVAREGYRHQCQNPANLCDPNNARNVVSHKYIRSKFENMEQQDVESQICNGNPVMLKFKKARGGQHFMLATGYTRDGAGNKTFLLHNPGAADGRDVTYSGRLKDKYPEILGYVLFKPSSDPSMIYLSAPSHVDLVVTDPLGRRTGFDPSTNTSYSEIPGADYSNQSIDTPNEDGFMHETLVSEKYFSSTQEVIPGDYRIKIFGRTSGEYYLDYRGYDVDGYTNASVYRTGELREGESEIHTIRHSIEPAQIANAVPIIHKYRIKGNPRNGFQKSDIELFGEIRPNAGSFIEMKNEFRLRLGTSSNFTLTVPASHFKTVRVLNYRSYTYSKDGAFIELLSTGVFTIKLKGVELDNPNQLGLISINIDQLFAQLNSDLICDRNSCDLDDERHDHPKHPRHRCKWKHKGHGRK